MCGQSTRPVLCELGTPDVAAAHLWDGHLVFCFHGFFPMGEEQREQRGEWPECPCPALTLQGERSQDWTGRGRGECGHVCRTQLHGGEPGRRKVGQGLQQTGAQEVPMGQWSLFRGHVRGPWLRLSRAELHGQVSLGIPRAAGFWGREEEPPGGRQKGPAGGEHVFASLRSLFPGGVWRKSAGPAILRGAAASFMGKAH